MDLIGSLPRDVGVREYRSRWWRICWMPVAWLVALGAALALTSLGTEPGTPTDWDSVGYLAAVGAPFAALGLLRARCLLRLDGSTVTVRPLVGKPVSFDARHVRDLVTSRFRTSGLWVHVRVPAGGPRVVVPFDLLGEVAIADMLRTVVRHRPRVRWGEDLRQLAERYGIDVTHTRPSSWLGDFPPSG